MAQVVDKQKLLESLSTRELIQELKHRYAEFDEARSLFVGPSALRMTVPEGKNPNLSAAKARYWAGWRAYKAAHPGSTVSEWKKSLKKSKT